MRYMWMVLLLVFLNKAYCQINPADSTVQVIAYWDKNETHSYSFSFKKLKLKDKDTVTTQDVSYKADIKIVDSLSNSYTIEWKYRDYSFGNVTGRRINDSGICGLIKLFQNQIIRFETDENGSFKELLNWEELRDKLSVSIATLKTNTKLSSELTFLLQEALTKETIENLLIKDVQLFYMFYGLKLELGIPVEEQIDSGNSITGPLKSDISLLLEQIDFEEMVYKVSYYQVFDEAAVSTFKGSKATGVLDGIFSDIEREEIENTKFLSFEDFYISLFHDSGWLLSMLYDRVASFSNKEQIIERRTIQFIE